MNMDLINKVGIITGGASGIGRSITLELAKRGCAVVINYHTSQLQAEALIAEITAFGGKAIAIQADVGQMEDAKRLVQTAIDQFGGLNILVNNAGIVADNLLLRMTEEQFDAVINTNLKGVWNMCKCALKPLLKSDYGRIVNISSVSGVLGNAGQTNYSAAKAGIIGLSKALAREIASRQVTVNVVAPGFIETAMTKTLNEELVSNWKQQIPMKRFGLPEEVAKAIAFLVGPDAGYITGHVLEIDGGIVM
jgi:3-oxoacyl-[acyl-carrier protein] reductase